MSTIFASFGQNIFARLFLTLKVRPTKVGEKVSARMTL